MLHDKALMDEELLFMGNKGKLQLRMEYASGKDTVNMFGATTKYLKYFMNLIK
jgi:hypothetical protein